MPSPSCAPPPPGDRAPPGVRAVAAKPEPRRAVRPGTEAPAAPRGGAGDPLLDLTRGEIADAAALAATYLETVRLLVVVRDDVGTTYAFRRLLAHVRFMAKAVKLLIGETPDAP